MNDELRTTWLEVSVGIVHDVTITSMHAGRFARSIDTDCGVPVWVVKVEGDGPRNCVLCPEQEWLQSITEIHGSQRRHDPVSPGREEKRRAGLKRK